MYHLVKFDSKTRYVVSDISANHLHGDGYVVEYCIDHPNWYSPDNKGTYYSYQVKKHIIFSSDSLDEITGIVCIDCL